MFSTCSMTLLLIQQSGLWIRTLQTCELQTWWWHLDSSNSTKTKMKMTRSCFVCCIWVNIRVSDAEVNTSHLQSTEPTGTFWLDHFINCSSMSICQLLLNPPPRFVKLLATDVSVWTQVSSLLYEGKPAVRHVYMLMCCKRVGDSLVGSGAQNKRAAVVQSRRIPLKHIQVNLGKLR